MMPSTRLSFVTGLALFLSQLASGEPLPPPSGQYNVGARREVIPFINPDNVSPNNVSTEYLATFYYPTLDSAPCAPKPYLEPELAEMYYDLYTWNISHLTSTVRWNASYLDEAVGPTVIFGPGGWGPPTDAYTIIFSELASLGYVVAALDHPYEQPFVRYPNGTGVYGLAIDFSGTLPFVEELAEVRSREMLHFIDTLPSLAASMGAPFETDNLGTFGHSLGGATALSAALSSPAVAAAINQDGTMYTVFHTPASDIRKPTMLLGMEIHIPENDLSWREFMEFQTGWWLYVTVTGVMHLDWSDLTWWKKYGGRALGTIDSQRMVDLTNTYITAFFDRHLKGVPSDVLEGQTGAWPEVNYIGVHEAEEQP
ncbi:platelet-activating factor acetylhydrolase [Stachybotrys elegans]|uniref:1-alkyl-2-acetylglycerophosphocholine esterase n=1 Tax=Stachybotrys elegans TaxID=80388 RepID=A0A8K0SL40_9HYPO|nr:platelet-activating factor acetylhydrolase [Stachybotrys elegans]